MEALIILLSEFLLGPVIAFATVVIEFMASMFGILLELIFGYSRKDKKAKQVATQGTPSLGKQKSGALRLFNKISIILFLVIMGILLVINFVAFDPVMQWLIAKVEKETAIEVEVSEVSGNLFLGKIAFDTVKVHRESEVKTSFDLQAKEVMIDIDLPSLLFRPITLDQLAVTDVKGSITRPDIEKQKKDKHAGKIKTKRNFVVEDLQLSKIDLAISKGSNAPVTIAFDKVSSAPA